MSAKAAKRYAKAFIDLSIEQNKLEQSKNDMLLLLGTLKTNSVLNAVLKNPIVRSEKKGSIVESVFSAHTQALTMSFLNLSIQKGRSAMLLDIATAFVDIYNELKGIVKVSVISAVDLTKDAEGEIARLVKSIQGKDIELEKKVNPALLGGFILNIGDRQLDASVAGSLLKIKKSFQTK